MPLFDADKYKIPAGNIPAILALGRGLVSAYRKDAPPLVKKIRKRLDEAITSLEEAWAKLDAAAGGLDPRLADNAVDSAHAAIAAVLDSYSWLPRHLDPKDVADAKLAHDRLYGEGLSFLKLPFPEEWAESEKRVKRIQDENLQGTLERICGKPLVAALFQSHKEYGAALGITQAEDPIIVKKVGEPFSTITTVVNQYVRAVIGSVDEDEPETVELATAMLRPVEVYRERILAARAGGKLPDAPVPLPTDPVPAPPAPPVAPVAPVTGGGATPDK